MKNKVLLMGIVLCGSPQFGLTAQQPAKPKSAVKKDLKDFMKEFRARQLQKAQVDVPIYNALDNAMGSQQVKDAASASMKTIKAAVTAVVVAVLQQMNTSLDKSSKNRVREVFLALQTVGGNMQQIAQLPNPKDVPQNLQKSINEQLQKVKPLIQNIIFLEQSSQQKSKDVAEQKNITENVANFLLSIAQQALATIK